MTCSTPPSFLGVWFARAVGRSTVWLVLVVTPLLVLALVLIQPDLEIGSVLLAPLCGLFGYLIAFSLAGLVGISGLFLRCSDGLNELRDALTNVLGAAIVPLSFYPDTVVQVLGALPFVYVYYVPIKLLGGLDDTTVGDVVGGGVWAAALLAALAFATTASRLRLVTDGG